MQRWMYNSLFVYNVKIGFRIEVVVKLMLNFALSLLLLFVPQPVVLRRENDFAAIPDSFVDGIDVPVAILSLLDQDFALVVALYIIFVGLDGRGIR